MNKSTIALFFVLAVFSISVSAQKFTDNIRLNHIGFYPNGPKIAIIVKPKSDKFYILSVRGKDTLFSGTLGKTDIWEFSGESVSKADSSNFTRPGSYILTVPGIGNSYPFDIKSTINLEPGIGSLKFYYYQRTVIPLEEKYAGKLFARKAGHPDDKVFVHASAATAKRPEGTVLSSSKGWYDAGDYNKYIVNSGISTYTLLNLYENFPAYFDTLILTIPESKNNIPDLLDESLWNLKWMITMQDDDGGVYHKLTNANFDGSVMPEEAISTRYVVAKSTAATLNFAAVMAQASRIVGKYDKSFADSCLTGAVKAYAWAKKNPAVFYEQDLMNAKYEPKIQTGGYGDNNVSDEFQWAAAELWIATKEAGYFEDIKLETALANNSFGLPGWSNVNTLGLYSLAKASNNFPEQKDKLEAAKAKIIVMADECINAMATSAFSVPMGKNDFGWGSNASCANKGMLLIQAYLLTKDEKYVDAAISSVDYLLGRNGTGYSYLTGYGEKSSRNPHHRPSEADGIDDPIPGMLVGGPNPGQQDIANCAGKYSSSLPAKSYADDKCSYASNEVAINWNAPFAFILFAIDAAKGGKK